jgi:hypothetical protein
MLQQLKRLLTALIRFPFTEKHRDGAFAKLRALMRHATSYRQPELNYFTQICGYIRLQWMKLLSRIPGFEECYSVAALSSLQESVIFRHEDLRPLFEHKMTVLKLAPQSRNHTHATSAAERTGANIALVELAKRAGFRPYVVSQSSSDEKMSIAGSRYFYWSKDLGIPFRDDPVEDKDCLIFIDVDFHCDMNRYLDFFKPILIYTFVPTTVSGSSEEHTFSVVNDKIFYRVRGGAEYSHYIWNYDGDCITKIDQDGSLLTYDITQKEIEGSPGRRLIFIMPRTHTPWPYYEYLSPANGIKRKRFSTGPVNMAHNDITDDLSLSMALSPYSVNLKGRMVAALLHRLRTKKTTSPEVGDIEAFLLSEKAMLKEQHMDIPKDFNDPKVTAALLHEMVPYLFGWEPNVTHTSTIPTTYTSLGPYVTVDSKPTCQLITTPLAVKPAVLPAKHPNNEIAAIKGRVEKVMNRVTPPREYKQYAQEFVELLIPTPHIGCPIDYSEVIEIQNKSAQRARANQVFDCLGPNPPNTLETFNKAEAYNGTSDPRIITTMKPKLTIDMSRFTIPFKNEVLKKFHWYAPGKIPREILEIIKRIGEHGFIDTDYNRFDGTISEWLQINISEAAYMRWINQNDAAQFKKDFDEVFQQTARTQSGLKYDSGWGTRSGSPITTDGNTMKNVFIVYAALRTIGYTKEQAWALLGIYAGDDGLTPALAGLMEAIEFVAKTLGLSVKISRSNPNEPVPFLGRILIAPLTSDDSFQDPKRTIPKLHVSTNKTVSVEQAAINKAAGYMVTDHKTPIISHWAIKVIEKSGLKDVKNQTPDEAWKLTETGAWPQRDEAAIREAFCRVMNWTTQELDEKVEQIRNVDGPFPLAMPIIYDNTDDHPDKLDSLVGEDIVMTTGNRVECTELPCRNQQTKPKLKPPTQNHATRGEHISRKPLKKQSFPETSGLKRESGSFSPTIPRLTKLISSSATSSSQNQKTIKNTSHSSSKPEHWEKNLQSCRSNETQRKPRSRNRNQDAPRTRRTQRSRRRSLSQRRTGTKPKSNVTNHDSMERYEQRIPRNPKAPTAPPE